jgi:hypothetical protein
MSTPCDRDRAFAIVREVIREWAPYSLLANGAPCDEWDREIRSIVAQIPRIESHIDTAHAISRVFLSSIQPDGFSPSDCAAIGRRLYCALADAGIVTGEKLTPPSPWSSLGTEPSASGV